MNYEEFIDYNRNKEQGPYAHKHHIIPKCVGGTDDPENLIELSWLTHWYAHYLLVKENPDDEKIQKAFWIKDIDSWLHWCYKVKFPSEQHNENVRKANLGTVKSKETKEKISESNKGKHSKPHKQHKKHEFKNGRNTKLNHWKLVNGKRVWYEEKN